MGPYDEAYRRSLDDPDGFWRDAATAIDWIEPFDRVIDRSIEPAARWFTGGVLNTCANAVDRHVAGGRADQLAIVYDSPVTATVRTLTYAALRDEVARLAGALAALGVVKGDAVIIYMPMVPEAVIAMLACARLGAVHSACSVAAPNELAVRIDDARPKVIMSASCGIQVRRVIEYKPVLDRHRAATHKPDACVVLRRSGATASGTPLPAARWSTGATTGTNSSSPPSPTRAWPWPPPTRSILYVGDDGSRRASCAR
jgi:propionyl-CoA synthetase